VRSKAVEARVPGPYIELDIAFVNLSDWGNPGEIEADQGSDRRIGFDSQLGI
jgi:hypothetical protein